MALPSAQLGQMPTMQLPYTIPVQTYQKQPKAWQSALLQILAQTGTAVAERGAANYMQPEYASEFGQQPNSGLQALLKGPRVGAQQAESLRGQKLTGGQMAEMGRHNVAEEAVVLSGQRTQSDIAAAQAQAAMEREQLASQTSENITGVQTRSAQGIAEAERQFKTPGEKAMTGFYGAHTQQVEQQTQQEKAATAGKRLGNYLMTHGGQLPKPGEVDPMTGMPFDLNAVNEARANNMGRLPGLPQ